MKSNVINHMNLITNSEPDLELMQKKCYSILAYNQMTGYCILRWSYFEKIWLKNDDTEYKLKIHGWIYLI